MSKNRIPTAEDFFKHYATYCQFEEGDPEYLVDKEDFLSAMKEFAKLHVKAALESAAENSMIVLKSGYGRMNEPDNESTITKKMKTFSDEQRGFGECTYNTTFVDKDSILNSYTESLIT